MIRTSFFLLILLATSANCFTQDVLKVTGGAVFTVDAGVSVHVTGGASVNNTGKLVNNGTITIAGSPQVTANFTDQAITTYHYGNGQFIFSGTGIQTISSSNHFGKLVIDNAATVMGSDLQSDQWLLRSGVIHTGAFAVVVSSPSATALSADIQNPGFLQSWVDGKLRRTVSVSTVNNYSFPVGNASAPALLEMDNLMASPLDPVNNITVSFGPKVGTDAGLLASEYGTTYSGIGNAGVWHLIPDVLPATGKFDLKLFIKGFTGLADNSFGILGRAGNSSLGADWHVPAGSVLPTQNTPGRTVSGGYARRNNISAGGQFGIATALSALPLQLLDFSGMRKDNTVVLEWTTDNEINTSHFEVYHSGQLLNPQSIGLVPASGSSSGTRHYTFTDKNPVAGVNNYQLKMVDADGQYKLSKTIKVQFENNASLNVYPNPVTGNMLYVSYKGATIKSIKLITLDGKSVPCSFESSGNNQLKVNLGKVHAKGTYALHLDTPEGVLIRMVVLQ